MSKEILSAADWANKSREFQMAASLLLPFGLWAVAAFLAHQSLEFRLKGVYLLLFGKNAKKTHSLGKLFSVILDKTGINENPKMDGFSSFLGKFEMVYNASRYIKTYPLDLMETIEQLNQMEEVLEWLTTLQP